MKRSARPGLALSLLVALAGCQTLYPTPKVEVATPTYVAPPVIPVPEIHNGSIFQADQYRPLFEDYRARLVGDSITVQITEKVSATQTSTSTIDKTGKVTAVNFWQDARWPDLGDRWGIILEELIAGTRTDVKGSLDELEAYANELVKKK